MGEWIAERQRQPCSAEKCIPPTTQMRPATTVAESASDAGVQQFAAARTSASSLPASLRYALVHLTLRGLRFILKFLWHLERQKRKICGEGTAGSIAGRWGHGRGARR